MTRLCSPFRSPSQEGSGPRPNPIYVVRAGSVALLSRLAAILSTHSGGVPDHAAREGRPAGRAVESPAPFSRGLRLAGRGLGYLRTVMDLAGSVAPSRLSDAALMVQPGPSRVVVLVSCVTPLSVHCSSLLWRPQDNTEHAADVQKLLAGFANAYR